jgi:hypothetical protein
MITTNQLMNDNKYKYKHLKIEVIEQDENSNVLVFAASYIKTTLPGEAMSEGHMEINKTLWKDGSTKRPPDYWVLGGSEENGVAKSYFVADEWLDNTPTETKDTKRLEWKIRK